MYWLLQMLCNRGIYQAHTEKYVQSSLYWHLMNVWNIRSYLIKLPELHSNNTTTNFIPKKILAQDYIIYNLMYFSWTFPRVIIVVDRLIIRFLPCLSIKYIYKILHTKETRVTSLFWITSPIAIHLSTKAERVGWGEGCPPYRVMISKHLLCSTHIFDKEQVNRI